MSNVFLFGASGKMGKEISKLIESDKKLKRTEKIESADVIIDFSNAEAFLKNLQAALKNKTPFVCGTTGLSAKQFKALRMASKKIPTLWASNMSMGVTVINEMLKNLRAIKDYDFSIEETHHIHKKDAPSGTALTIQSHLEKAIKKKIKDITSHREGEVFGQHKVIIKGPEETILIQHDALNRTVFARGAVTCAKWILKKKAANYSIEDVLK
ncbi:MAG: dihydrodipicolinate reductase C-terminal domain-containing protein [Bdellovibrionota bacterium]